MTPAAAVSREAMHPVEASVTIEDLLRRDRTLLEIAADVLHQLGQQFGLPELSMLRRDGQLNPVDWSTTWQSLLIEWGRRADVEIVWTS